MKSRMTKSHEDSVLNGTMLILDSMDWIWYADISNGVVLEACYLGAVDSGWNEDVAFEVCTQDYNLFSHYPIRPFTGKLELTN